MTTITQGLGGPSRKGYRAIAHNPIPGMDLWLWACAGRFLSTETPPQKHRPSTRAGRAGKPAGMPRSTINNCENQQKLRDPAPT